MLVQAPRLSTLDLGMSDELTRTEMGANLEIMTQAAEKFLSDFDELPAQDRAEVLRELLRRLTAAPYDLPSDDDLVAAADQLFVELDRHEPSQ
jgi:hypothetical protein